MVTPNLLPVHCRALSMIEQLARTIANQRFYGRDIMQSEGGLKALSDLLPDLVAEEYRPTCCAELERIEHKYNLSLHQSGRLSLAPVIAMLKQSSTPAATSTEKGDSRETKVS